MASPWATNGLFIEVVGKNAGARNGVMTIMGFLNDLSFKTMIDCLD